MLINKPLVSIIIPTYNRKEKLMRLIDSVIKSEYPKDKIEIIVVDDCSEDGTSGEVKKLFPNVLLLRNRSPRLLAYSRNIGIKKSKGDFIFFIDDDNVMDPHAISELKKFITSTRTIGVAVPIAYYYKYPKRIWSGLIRATPFIFKKVFVDENKLDTRLYKKPSESEGFHNAFMIRRDVIERVGMFDDKNFPIQQSEEDYYQRIKLAGYRVAMVPSAKVWHDIPPLFKQRSAVVGLRGERIYYMARNRILLVRKHASIHQIGQYAGLMLFLLIFSLHHITFILAKANNKKVKLTKFVRGIVDGLSMKLDKNF